MKHWALPFALAAATSLAFAADAPGPKSQPAWRAAATLDDEKVTEPSGVVASRRRPGYFWTHGDSGNAPMIAAFDAAGHVVARVDVANAPNIDWEDIAADDAGHLYVGDIGNNYGILPMRYVYQFDEPDPLDPPKTAIEPKTKWRFKYPAGKPRLNLESLAWRVGKLYIIPRENTPQTTLYTLVAGEGPDATLESVGMLNVYGASGADFSPDGSRLAVCSLAAVWVFPIEERDGKVAWGAPRVVRFPLTRTLEGCCFTEGGLLLVDEERRVFRISDEQIKAQTVFAAPKPGG